MKLAVVVRKDLGMSCGKISVQVGHACVETMISTNMRIIWKWIEDSQKKIVLKIDGLDEIVELKKQCESKNIPCRPIFDIGLTQVPANTLTCIAIGPVDDEIISSITRNLKLL